MLRYGREQLALGSNAKLVLLSLIPLQRPLPLSFAVKLLCLIRIALSSFNRVSLPRVFISNEYLMQQLLRSIGRKDVALACSTRGINFEAFIWSHMCAVDDRLTGRPMAATIIQKGWRAKTARRDRAARRIQLGCRDWIHKPKTRDGRIGINLRIIMGMQLGFGEGVRKPQIDDEHDCDENSSHGLARNARQEGAQNIPFV